MGYIIFYLKTHPEENMLPHYENKLNEIRIMVCDVLSDIISSSKSTLIAFKTDDISLYESAKSKIKNLQSNTNKIDNEIIKIFALFAPEAAELRLLVAYLKMTNEINRIGDGVRKYSKQLSDYHSRGSDMVTLKNSIILLHQTTIDALECIKNCLDTLEQCDSEDIHTKVLIEESKNDDLFSIVEKELLGFIIDSGELGLEYIKILSTLRRLERIGDRGVNIASLLLYAQKGGKLNIHH